MVEAFPNVDANVFTKPDPCCGRRDRPTNCGFCCCTRINAKLESFDHWSATAIEDRQEMLIGLAKEIWTTASIDAG